MLPIFFLLILVCSRIEFVDAMVPKLPKFSLITCNLLYEQWYEMNAVDRMSLSARAKSFANALKQPIFQNVDIFCFQEWPYTPYESKKFGKIKPNDEFFKALKNGLGQNFLNIYEAIKPTEAVDKDNVYMLVKKATFNILKSGTTAFDEEKPDKKRFKRFAYAILQDKKTSTKIGVINAHIPFLNQEKHFEKIRNQIVTLDKQEKIEGWVICGDFNYNTWDMSHFRLNSNKYNDLATRIYSIFNQNVSSNVDQIKQPTSFGTVQKPVYEFNDYIFYTTNLGDACFSIYPKDISEFIRHGQPKKGTDWWYQNNSYKNYFSDHAALRVDFLGLESKKKN